MSKFTTEQVINFDSNDWKFDESSGYHGVRNINPKSGQYNDWLYMNEYRELVDAHKVYKHDDEILRKFRLECLPFGEYPDYVIMEFLNKLHFQK